MKTGDLIHLKGRLGTFEVQGLIVFVRSDDGWEHQVKVDSISDAIPAGQPATDAFLRARVKLLEAERDAEQRRRHLAEKERDELRDTRIHVGSPTGRIARPEHLAAQDGHNADLSAAAIRYGGRRDSPATAAADDVTRANPVEPGEARMETATEAAKGSPDRIISSNPQFVEDWHNDRLSRLEERAAAEGFDLVIEGEAGEGPAPADATPSIRVTHQRVMPGVCAVTMEASGELPPGDYVLANRLEH